MSSLAAWAKGNLLSLSPEELNEGLSQFVKEVCRPNGERYSPDSIFYLCLGIQQVGIQPERSTRGRVINQLKFSIHSSIINFRLVGVILLGGLFCLACHHFLG